MGDIVRESYKSFFQNVLVFAACNMVSSVNSVT